MEPANSDSAVFEENMRFIDLAHDRMFINSRGKEKTIKCLEEKSRDNPDIHVKDIFKQENLISDKRLAYLLSLDEHLQTQSLDQQFGKIANANSMAAKEDIHNALVYQKIYFKKNGVTRKIGEILVEKKIISPADQTAILLTQNRIKNENLFNALNSIGKTQKQRDDVNRRFGAIAIKDELVTIEDVKNALEIQKKERQTKERSRFIGEILKERVNLSDKDILNILLEQKQFEKRVLDLEKAVFTFKDEIRISKKLNRLFKYTVSEGGLEAFATKLAETDEKIPTCEFLIWLKMVGIKFGIVNDSVLEEFLLSGKKNSQIMVAKGYPPKQCINESIKLYFNSGKEEFEEEKPQREEAEREKPDEEEPAEEKSGDKEPDDEEQEKDGSEEEKPEKVKTVTKGSLLAQIIPGEQGLPGKNVLGYPVQPEKPSVSVLYAGEGVIRKGSNFHAQINGCPIIKNGTTLMVESAVKKNEINTIRGDISSDTKNNYESAIVELKGDITREAVLKCFSLLLHGNLMGCATCTGNIVVKGDIGSDIQSEDDRVQQTTIICQGSVKASKSILNARIHTADKLLAYKSTVTGSEVTACKGIAVREVLNGANTSSTLWLGIKPENKILDTDHTIEIKTAELAVLKKDADIAVLTQEYQQELKEEQDYQAEQELLKKLVEIIDTVDLYQHEILEDKINYLYHLPEFSSVKKYYLDFPQTDHALSFLNEMISFTEKMSLEEALKYIKEKIDPEPEKEEGEEPEEEAQSKIYHIEAQFKARLAALEQEVSDQSEDIDRINNEIKALQDLKEKLISMEDKVPLDTSSAIRIKNKCEKGTVIKGRTARMVLKKSVYNIKFKEALDPKTNNPCITIEDY